VYKEDRTQISIKEEHPVHHKRHSLCHIVFYKLQENSQITGQLSLIPSFLPG